MDADNRVSFILYGRDQRGWGRDVSPLILLYPTPGERVGLTSTEKGLDSAPTSIAASSPPTSGNGPVPNKSDTARERRKTQCVPMSTTISGERSNNEGGERVRRKLSIAGSGGGRCCFECSGVLGKP
jgi:hypothetical protein